MYVGSKTADECESWVHISLSIDTETEIPADDDWQKHGICATA
jgi:hypothetical protein